MSARSEHLSGRALTLVALLVVLGFGGYQYAVNFADEQTRTCTITSLDRTSIARENAGSDARVYTEQCGTLAVRDAWLQGQTRSADLYGQLGPGEWELRTAGLRNGLFSWMPNILDAEPVAPR